METLMMHLHKAVDFMVAPAHSGYASAVVAWVILAIVMTLITQRLVVAAGWLFRLIGQSFTMRFVYVMLWICGAGLTTAGASMLVNDAITPNTMTIVGIAMVVVAIVRGLEYMLSQPVEEDDLE